jgi:opacity protein-like surface antigen
MKKILIILIAAFAFGTSAQAQDFKSAVGLRLGYPLSISYKTFMDEKSAIEGYVGFRAFSGVGSYFTISGAYQIHNDFPDVNNLQWYYGAGASVNFWSFKSTFLEDFSSTSFGVQGYLGLSYTLEDTPLNLSVDWIPTIFLGGYSSGFGGGYGSLAARYILNR